jgi:ferritin-like metal-binding protein YciE
MLSIEKAAMERLHARIQQCPLPQVREQLVHHLQETREQKDRLASLIQALGGQPTEERAQLAAYSPPTSLANSLQASNIEEEKEFITLAIDALIEQQEVLGYNTLIQYAAKMNIGEAASLFLSKLRV